MKQILLENFSIENGADEGEEYGFEEASFEVLLAPFRDLRNVLVGRLKPQKTSLAYLRNLMR